MMKDRENRPGRFLWNLYSALLTLAALLVLIFLGGTLYALVFRPAAPPAPPPARTSPARMPPAAQPGNTFTGIGRIRTNTADNAPGTVILSITFPYNPQDRAFSEELAAKVGNFRDSAREYFGSFTGEELLARGEAALKQELLQRYNALLRLGRIETLYFNDFIVIK
ncbi:MAG: flagellar basal body-associated FliL family protein [Treponema sp.]|jgi:flagellar basal body-associated protein FliL|nr:flagellar basal body-associated FliL family protein [Treponema sp.]